MDNQNNLLDNIRFGINLFYRMIGVGVLTFFFWVAFKFGIPNLAIVLFYIFIGLYMMFAQEFINDIKKRQSRWSGLKYIIAMIALWLPVTLINCGIIYGLLFSGVKIIVPVLLMIVLLLAWSMVPVNMLLDYWEKK